MTPTPFPTASAHRALALRVVEALGNLDIGGIEPLFSPEAPAEEDAPPRPVWGQSLHWLSLQPRPRAASKWVIEVRSPSWEDARYVLFEEEAVVLVREAEEATHFDRREEAVEIASRLKDQGEWWVGVELRVVKLEEGE